MVPNVAEPVVVNVGNKNNPDIITEGRDDIRRGISGEELLDRLCFRIKALFDLKSATIIQYTIKGRFMSR